MMPADRSLHIARSGTRSSIIWSFGMAGRLSTDEIISATTQAGYQLGQMRPQLDAIAAQ